MAKPRTYLFDHDAEASPMLAELSEILDPWTRKSIDDTGVVRSGARCLDLGAGLGILTDHLADLVGTDGQVTAVDANTRHLQWLHRRRNITVVQADLRSDPLPDGPWDLIVARSVLPWLPERDCITHRAAAQLAPNGVLMTIDFRPAWDTCLLDCAPEFEQDARDVFRRYHRALSATMASVEHDAGWHQRALAAFHAAGLGDLATRQYSRSWRGGEAGCMLPFTAATEAHERLEAADAGSPQPWSTEDLGLFRQLLTDPRTVILGLPIYVTAGRRDA